MDADSPQLSLKWNHFQENFTSQFEFLKNEEEFVDVTFSCQGKLLRAHRVVLSASSPYLTSLFKENPCKHPVIILDEMPLAHLEWLLAFIYTGAVSVPEVDLPALIETANLLQIRGLSERTQQTDSVGGAPADPIRKRSRVSQEACMDTQEPTSVPKRAARIEAARRTSRWSAHEPKSEEVLLSENKVNVEDIPNVTQVKNEPLNSLQKIEADFGLQELTNEVLSSNDFGTLAQTVPPAGPTKPPAPAHHLSEAWDTPTPSQVYDEMSAADGRRRHSLDPRPCPICKRHYSNLSNLRQHLRLIHNPQLVKCKLCDKTFKTDLYLRRHLVGFHYIDQSGPFRTGGAPPPAPVPVPVETAMR